MIVLTTSTGTQNFRFIPRVFTTDITVKFTDDITFDDLTTTEVSTTQVGDYINHSFTLTGLKENRFYTLRVQDNSSNVIYKDKLFVTNQGTDQLSKEKYTINKDVYVEKSTGENDYIVI